jgi:hypothetical protein
LKQVKERINRTSDNETREGFCGNVPFDWRLNELLYTGKEAQKAKDSEHLSDQRPVE